MPNGIIIAGGRKSTGYKELGHLALEILKYLEEINQKVLVYDKDSKANYREYDTVIYTERDGKRLQQIIGLCQKYSLNLLNLATGVTDNVTFPEKMKFTFVDAPNSAIKILKQIRDIEEDSGYWEFPKHTAIVSEWHQWSKTSTPGTAKEIAKILKDILLNDTIYSGRSPKEAMLHGIPQEYLSGFGLHIVEIYERDKLSSGTPIKEYRLEVLGRRPYAEGAFLIAKAMKRLHEREHHIKELIKANLL